MDIASVRDLAQTRLKRRAYKDGALMLGYGDAVLFQAFKPTSLEATIYRPLLCVVLQGAKEVFAGDNNVLCSAGQVIVVSHHLPVVSRIVSASNADPYVAIILPLETGSLRRYFELARPPESANGAALSTYAAAPAILDALRRLLELGEEPNEAPIIAPLIQDEIHARLLLSPIGGVLARLMRYDDKAAQIAKATNLIRANISQSIKISDLADAAGMSKSAFHVHFRTITRMSPLMYAKDLRLIQAQIEVRDGRRAIGNIAHDVGYESPAQFSRDYGRKFGLSPRQDRARNRIAA